MCNLKFAVRLADWFSKSSFVTYIFLWHDKCLCYIKKEFESLARGRGLEATSPRIHEVVMSILDLTKATVFCGGVSFLIYSFPLLSQILFIGLMTVLWLSYAHRTVMNWRRKSGTQ